MVAISLSLSVLSVYFSVVRSLFLCLSSVAVEHTAGGHIVAVSRGVCTSGFNLATEHVDACLPVDDAVLLTGEAVCTKIPGKHEVFVAGGIMSVRRTFCERFRSYLRAGRVGFASGMLLLELSL